MQSKLFRLYYRELYSSASRENAQEIICNKHTHSIAFTQNRINYGKAVVVNRTEPKPRKGTRSIQYRKSEETKVQAEFVLREKLSELYVVTDKNASADRKSSSRRSMRRYLFILLLQTLPLAYLNTRLSVIHFCVFSERIIRER